MPLSAALNPAGHQANHTTHTTHKRKVVAAALPAHRVQPPRKAKLAPADTVVAMDCQ
jgi:hypothetical protein